jgi:hypothetical protein
MLHMLHSPGPGTAGGGLIAVTLPEQQYCRPTLHCTAQPLRPDNHLGGNTTQWQHHNYSRVPFQLMVRLNSRHSWPGPGGCDTVQLPQTQGHALNLYSAQAHTLTSC